MKTNLESNILEGCHILYEEDYDTLKKMTVNLYKNKQKFWSEVFPETDTIVSETIVECVDPSYYYKILKYNIICTKTSQSSLKSI